jgi:hypothetical protein
MSETIVQNNCTRLGLRVVHVMCMGGPIASEPYVEMVPTLAMETLRIYQHCESLLDVQHLYLTWKAREALRMQLLTYPEFGVVAWWVAKGETLRQAAAQALYEYEMAYGDWPDVAWVRSAPSSAPETFEVCGHALNLRQVDWGIPGFLVVGREADYERSIHG